MKTFNVKSIDASPSNDEGLALVYFDFGNFEYFTLCFSDEEQEEIYIEYSEQIQSVYSNNISYKFTEEGLIFEFSKDVAKDINLGETILLKLSLDTKENNLLKNSMKAIFKHLNPSTTI